MPAQPASVSAALVLDTAIAVTTSEHSAFRFRIAGPVARLLAWVIDIALTIAVMLGISLLVLIVTGQSGLGVLFLLWFVLYWLAGAVLEWRWGGQTVGKKALGIRVVAEDGLPADVGACLLRNLLRYADAIPTAMTGLATMMASGRFQRLGDLAAGTLVVYVDDRGPARGANPTADSATRGIADGLPAEVLGVVDGPGAKAIAAWAAQRQRFHPARRIEMAAAVAKVLSQRLRLDPPKDPDRWLHAVHLRLSTAPVDGGSAAAARAATFLERRRPAWLRLEQWCDGGRAPRETTPGEAMDPAPARFAALLRATSADLALAEAYHLPEATVDHLHRLVARGNLRFHRTVRDHWRRIRRAVVIEAPARLSGDPCLRLAAASFMLPFILCGVWAFAAPESAAAWIGQDTTESMREMYEDAPRGRSVDQGSVMAGFYINNNVGIALACFASGIFLGVGSLIWLLANGAFLGAVFGWMLGLEEPVRSHFAEFVTAHGPFELGGIMLSGAAGLRLGLGLVATNGLTVAASLRRSAAAAVPILGVAAALVALAAPIEAFISPSDLPVAAKRTVMLLSALLIIVYIGILGPRGQRQLAAEARA